MTAGISTACFYPMNTEEAMGILSRNNVAACEVFLNSHGEMDAGYLRELRAVAEAGGTRILSVHPYTSGMEPMLFFSGYPLRFEDGRAYYRGYYEAAARLGADIVVFHGNMAQFHMEPAEYAQRLGILIEDAQKMGVRLCHENVSRCAGRDPAFFRELAEQLPEARFVLDVKQCLRSGEDVYAFVEAMAGRIAHVHISDHNAQADCLPIGKGTFHIPKFLSCLHAQGFCGDYGGVIIELYRGNFIDSVELMQSYQRLCGYVST